MTTEAVVLDHVEQIGSTTPTPIRETVMLGGDNDKKDVFAKVASIAGHYSEIHF